MSDGREWYPADWVDETCPPSRPSPDDFIVPVTGGFQLGYAMGDTTRGKFAREYADLYNTTLKIGDIIDFIACDRFSDVDITLRRDGTYELHGLLPATFNALVVDHDMDTLCDSLEDLIRRATSEDMWIFLDDENEKRVTLSLANWLDPEPLLFDIIDGKPAFQPLPSPAQKN